MPRSLRDLLSLRVSRPLRRRGTDSHSLTRLRRVARST